jgi:hypothetical protein
MGIFKKGDIVQLLDGWDHMISNIKTGDYGVVMENDINPFVKWNGNFKYAVNERDLKLVTNDDINYEIY